MGDFLDLYIDSFMIVAILIGSVWLVKVSTIKDKRYKKGEKIIDVGILKTLLIIIKSILVSVPLALIVALFRFFY